MKIINTILNGMIVTFFVSLVGIVFVQVICRYVLGNSLSWAEEFAQMVFVWLIYLGGIIAVRKGINISFDVFLEMLPYKFWVPVFAAGNLVSLGFLMVALFFGYEIASMNMTQSSAIMRIPMGLAYLAVPAGALGMVVSQVQYFRAQMQKRRTQG